MPSLRHLVALTLAGLVALTPAGAGAAAETPAVPEPPADTTAESILRDPARSPLLDRNYLGTDNSSPVLEHPGQEVFDQRFQIVHAARPHPGMRVAEIGVGSGVYSALFARAVGAEGTVYGVDTAPDIAARLEPLAKQYHVSNIVPVVATSDDVRLPEESIDLAFVCDAYHRFENPSALLDAIRKALVPYGTLIIIDDRRPPDPRVARDKQRASADRDAVVKTVEQAGFRLIEEAAILRDNYFLRFERPGDPPAIEVGPIESGAPAHEP